MGFIVEQLTLTGVTSVHDPQTASVLIGSGQIQLPVGHIAVGFVFVDVKPWFMLNHNLCDGTPKIHKPNSGQSVENLPSKGPTSPDQL